jgi:hypothetical protein
MAKTKYKDIIKWTSSLWTTAATLANPLWHKNF